MCAGSVRRCQAALARLPLGRGVQVTTAMEAGIRQHVWSIHETIDPTKVVAKLRPKLTGG